MTVSIDNPIRRADEDLLGRARAALGLADQLLALDVSQGLVVGVLGPWGSGKTSFVNLARTRLDDVGVTLLDFNPWMFSGAQQLVESFFVELSSQLRLKPDLAEIGQDLEEYGEAFSGLAWLPLVGPWIDRGRLASKLLAKMLRRGREGVGARRQKLEAALRGLDRPLVVVLDDIDRLTTPEIRDIFKLVRLTANFPNVIYMVAFDRRRVENALAEQGIPGRDYLEKILQIAIDLPKIPDSVLDRQVFNAIDAALAGLDPEAPFSDTAWPDAYIEIIRPLLRNMRDIRRYTAAIRGTAIELQGQIELVDVLALEAVRVFLPDVFEVLSSATEGLTATSSLSYGGHGDPPHLKMQIEGLISAASSQTGVADALVQRLFPAAARHIGGSHYGSEWKKQWLRDRRVAHEDIFRFYLERVVGEGLQAFIDAEAAWALMTDQRGLEQFLRSLDGERLQDVVAALEVYEDDFTETQARPSIITLLNLLPDLPKRQRGMFELDTRMVVLRVVYRLVRAIPGQPAVEAAVRGILAEISTLSAKFDLVSQVGHREGRGHELVTKACAIELERDWRAEVRGASVEQLIVEPELLSVIDRVREESDPSEAPLSIPADPRLTAAMLASAHGQSRSQSVGSRAIRRSPRLAWDVLVKIYGDEQTLSTRLEELKESDVKVDADILSLADKYLSGWRPDHHED